MIRWASLLIWLFTVPAAAQGSGGSYGSSDFGGGSSGGGGGGGSSYGGSSGESGGSSEPARPESAVTFSMPDRELGATLTPAIVVPESETEVRDASATNFGCACLAAEPIVVLLLLGLAWRMGPTREERERRKLEGPCEVRRISIAFDWTARPELQAALTQLASQYADGGSEGRRRSASEIAARLEAALAAARFACFQSLRLNKEACQQKFHALGIDLRSRFRRETRGQRADGATAEFAAHANEGQGLVVISIVVAADEHLAKLPETLDRAAIVRALATIRSMRVRTVYGIEVVWSPAEEQDRLSSLELEAIYPELLPIDGVPRLGRAVCHYCRAPYPAELANCPGCGAPRRAPAPRA
jgi:hypothetical protein